MIELLWENEDAAVCIKPVGIPSQGDGAEAMPRLLAAQLGCAEVFPVHRLDQAAGGVMVYAKTARCAAYLSECVQNGTFQKEYVAVLEGVPAQEEAELQDLLYHDRARNKTFTVQRKRTGVKSARLFYRLSGVRDGHALVRIRLQTGRTHQIRVQFASRGLPLAGDGKYGSRDNRCTPALWCCRLTFPTPDGQVRSFFRLPPEQYPWTGFEKELGGCTEAM